MSTETKQRLLLAFSLLCLIGFAGQTIQLWKAEDRLAQVYPEQEELPASIEERLLAELDKKSPNTRPLSPFALTSPFSRSSQLQDYVDSLFSGFGMSPFPSGGLFSGTAMGGTVFRSSTPEIVLNETDEEYRIVIPVSPEEEIELSTNIENNSVSVSGVISERTQQSQNNFSSSFISQRQFARTVDLPAAIDEFGMATEQTENGIEITIPKKNS